MSKHQNLINAALVSVVALGGSLSAATAFADHEGMEQCAGVIKAGKNDCAVEAHGCKGQALATRSAGDFIYLPLGTCDKLTGGSLTE